MPVLKHAKKKLKQDKVRTLRNKKVRTLFRSLIKKAIAEPTPAAISAAVSQVDKAAKQNIIHKNKAARIKSQLAKVAANGGAVSSVPKAKVAANKKGAVKKSAAKKSSKK